MNEVDLLTPLLQLNPPVLVRADGGSPGDIDLVALRRAAEEKSGSPAHAATNTLSRSTPSSSSLAARKLHEAKSAARHVSHIGDVPSRAHTTEMPGRRKGPRSTLNVDHAAVQHLSAPPSTRAADVSTFGAAGSAPTSPSAAARSANAQRGAALPTNGSVFANHKTDDQGMAMYAAAAAASPASSDAHDLSLHLPYLMRHIQDTGALLDLLFPLQPTQGDAGSTRAKQDAVADVASVQTVSTAPASREEVMALHSTLRARLEARRARPAGLCGIRRAIYTDLFSELVRQVTVEEPTRGLLLARVRENEEHALHVHAALLREGENFVAGKLLQDTQNMTVLQARLSDLRGEKTQLEVRRHDLQDARQELERRIEEQRLARRAQQQDELNYLRRANQQLSLRLKMETERASTGTGGDVAGGSTDDGDAAGAKGAAPVAAS